MFPTALIKAQSIGNLLGNAGLIIGVGDGRPQKGKKAFGCWRVCADDDEEWHSIVKIGGTKAQDQALADPAYYDRETDQILTWFLNEKTTRGAQPAKSPRPRTPKSGSGMAPLPIVDEHVGNGAAVK
jgi:hypothetical protein